MAAAGIVAKILALKCVLRVGWERGWGGCLRKGARGQVVAPPHGWCWAKGGGRVLVAWFRGPSNVGLA